MAHTPRASTRKRSRGWTGSEFVMGKNKGPSFGSGKAAQGRAERAGARHAHAIAKAHGQSIGKKPPSALAAAIAASRRTQHSSSAGSSSSSIPGRATGGQAPAHSLSLHLAQLNDEKEEEDASTNETLIELVRAVVQEASGKIPLTELGGSVRALAAKRCLQAKFEGQEIHKKVKSKGGWESFVRAHAPDEFVVLSGCLCKRVSLPEPVVPAFTFEKMPAPRRSDVNGLSLDAVGL